LKTCPHKEAGKAGEFIRLYNWSKEGRLGYLYGPDELPAYMGQAIDVIGAELGQAWVKKIGENNG